jgi:hypothetical protein
LQIEGQERLDGLHCFRRACRRQAATYTSSPR